jgi:hypothetical protein
MHKPPLAANVNYTEQVPRFDELPTGPLRVSRLAAGPGTATANRRPRRSVATRTPADPIPGLEVRTESQRLPFRPCPWP